MDERESEFVARMRLGAELCPPKQFLSVAPDAVSHLCDLAARAEKIEDLRYHARQTEIWAQTAEDALRHMEQSRDSWHDAAGRAVVERDEIQAEYATAIELLGEIGLMLVIAGIHKQPLFKDWKRARTKVLRTPRAQAVLGQSALHKRYVEREKNSDG